MTVRLLATVLTTAALLTACTGPKMLGNPQLPYPPTTPPRVGDILHLPTGINVTETQMLDAATDARIVYVGETHDNPAVHRLELTLLQALAQRYPGRTALAMEMFTPSQQTALDGWVGGELSEKEFSRRWYNGWTMDFDYYRDLLLFARENHIPILGINAEKALVKAVGRTPFSELSAAEQAQLPKELDLTDPYQTALAEAIFSGHDRGSAMFAGFHRIQTLWDETMAENIVRYLASPQGEESHLLVVAGGNHVRNGFGIPRRVFRRLPISSVLIGVDELEVSAAKQKEAYMDVKMPSFPMPAFDYLVYTRYEELEKQGVKLGVMLEEKAGRVRVTGLLPGSTGEKGGLQAGDFLLAIDGQSLADSFDLVYALKQKHFGDTVRLAIERDGARLELEIRFAAPPAPEP